MFEKTHAAPSQNYVLIVFIISCSILTGFTYNIYRQAQQSQKTNDWLIHNYDVMRYVQRVRIFATEVESGQRGFLLTRSDAFLMPYNTNVNKLQQSIIDLEELIATHPQDEGLLARVKLLREHTEVVNRALYSQLMLYKNTSARTLKVKDLQISKDAMEAVRQDITDFATEQRERLEKYQEAYHVQQRQYYVVLFVGAGLAIGGLVVANLLLLTITARTRQTEEALNATRETYRLLLANLNDGIFDHRPLQNKIVYSDSYARMLGYEPQDIDHSVEGFNNLLHPDDADATWDAVRRYIAHETPQFAATFRLRAKDGSWRWIYSRGVGTWDTNDNFIRILGINTDISTQKAREEELQHLNNELEEFIYIVSHDLRAPLVNMKGFASEIEHAVAQIRQAVAICSHQFADNIQNQITQLFDNDIPESLNFIRSSVARMDMLTSAILDLSRIGRREYQMTLVDAQAVAQRCIDSLHYETSRKNISIVCENLPTITTDALALEQIFGNILDNAVKYCNDAKPGVITIEARDRADNIIFSVTDNGRGIATQDNKKVFDIFRRAGNSQDIRGNGLGLAFVKATLHKLGGRIWFQSTLGEGSTFYFSLPKKAATVIAS